MPSLIELIRTIRLLRRRKRYAEEKFLAVQQKHDADDGEDHDIRTPIQKIRHLCLRYHGA